MTDDLKDGEMLIDYACCLKEEGEETLAKLCLEDAAYRLTKSFKEFHNQFISSAQQEKGFNEETVATCLWDVQHEEMMEKYDNLIKRIEKIK